MPASAAFGRVIRRVRLKRGLSQEALADQCGLHRNAVGLIERGERSPSLETIVAIANGLGVRPSWLVANVEREMASSASGL